MGKAHYQRVISLNLEEENKVAELQKAGIKVIQIFRLGLQIAEQLQNKKAGKPGEISRTT